MDNCNLKHWVSSNAYFFFPFSSFFSSLFSFSTSHLPPPPHLDFSLFFSGKEISWAFFIFFLKAANHKCNKIINTVVKAAFLQEFPELRSRYPTVVATVRCFPGRSEGVSARNQTLSASLERKQSRGEDRTQALEPDKPWLRGFPAPPQSASWLLQFQEEICFSSFNEPSKHLWILLECRIQGSSLGVRPEILRFWQAPKWYLCS